jgi:hypothetical protein
MASLNPQEVRARVAAGAAGLSGWAESGAVYDEFGLDPQKTGHKRFAVGVISTENFGDRQRKSAGQQVQSEITIRWAHRLKPADQVNSYDDALTAEQALILGVLAVSEVGLQIHYDGTRNRVAAGSFTVTETAFLAIHHIALQ